MNWAQIQRQPLLTIHACLEQSLRTTKHPLFSVHSAPMCMTQEENEARRQKCIHGLPCPSHVSWPCYKAWAEWPPSSSDQRHAGAGLHHDGSVVCQCSHREEVCGSSNFTLDSSCSPQPFVCSVGHVCGFWVPRVAGAGWLWVVS